jgi:hypothetical protein
VWTTPKDTPALTSLNFSGLPPLSGWLADLLRAWQDQHYRTLGLKVGATEVEIKTAFKTQIEHTFRGPRISFANASCAFRARSSAMSSTRSCSGYECDAYMADLLRAWQDQHYRTLGLKVGATEVEIIDKEEKRKSSIPFADRASASQTPPAPSELVRLPCDAYMADLLRAWQDQHYRTLGLKVGATEVEIKTARRSANRAYLSRTAHQLRKRLLRLPSSFVCHVFNCVPGRTSTTARWA